MKEMQPLIFEGSFAFQETSDHFQFLDTSVHRVGDAITFSRIVITERRSAERILLIGTMMEKTWVLLKDGSLFMKMIHTNMHTNLQI